MNQEPKSAELLPLNTVRTETVLFRFPIHRLSKRGEISIEIREAMPTGEIKIMWEVDHPKKLGQPGPLAYKVDTLIINRRLDDAGRPLPNLLSSEASTISVGSLGLVRARVKTTSRKRFSKMPVLLSLQREAIKEPTVQNEQPKSPTLAMVSFSLARDFQMEAVLMRFISGLHYQPNRDVR